MNVCIDHWASSLLSFRNSAVANFTRALANAVPPESLKIARRVGLVFNGL